MCVYASAVRRKKKQQQTTVHSDENRYKERNVNIATSVDCVDARIGKKNTLKYGCKEAQKCNLLEKYRLEKIHVFDMCNWPRWAYP